MPAEPSIRDLFRTTPGPAARAVDAEAVIRRSKARRLPAQIGLGGVFTLAAGGIAVAGIQGLPGGTTGSSSSGAMAEQSADAPADLPQGDTGRVDPLNGDVSFDDTPGSADVSAPAPADRINLCGGTLAEVAPSETGLELTAHFPDAAVGTTPVEGIVTLTNTGAEPVSGFMSPTPAVTLSQDGVVLWHSNGMRIMSLLNVELAPGESLELVASFVPVVCGVEDDLDGFRDDLPAAGAGEYQVSAAADVTVGETAHLVTGPTSTVRLG
jgi:hypothetical protein